MKKAIKNIIYVIIFLLSTSIVIMIGRTIGSSNSSSSSSASSSSSLSSYVIQGKIIDEAGRPLNKISIQTSRVNDYYQSVLTNCDGEFVFNGLSSGLYTFILFLNDDSYSLVNEIENINLSGNQNIFNLQDIVLKKEVKPSWGPLH